MGLNVKSEETMPKLLEGQLKNYEVYNMGVVGFGPDQELNVLKKLQKIIKIKYLINYIRHFQIIKLK